MMTNTSHRIYFADSRNMDALQSESVDLIITSPPYPMIEMWDDLFCRQNGEIKKLLENQDSAGAFEMMHQELDFVWKELYRVLKDGGIACVNIGDAVRTIGQKFQLYCNHARILTCFMNTGFDVLPAILWRKQTNAPNKFMGSGMLPAGAYVTLEHEYILIFRKKNKREFINEQEKKRRMESSFFWEERNAWFSDIWDIKGIRQNLYNDDLRKRSAAYPFELAYRLINMYSLKGDLVLDPFAGTGATLFSAMASGRNSIGIEIDENFKDYFFSDAAKAREKLNEYITLRLNKHLGFVSEYERKKGRLKHINKNYNFPVMTKQEVDILINYIDNIVILDDNICGVSYIEKAMIEKDNLFSGIDSC